MELNLKLIIVLYIIVVIIVVVTALSLSGIIKGSTNDDKLNRLSDEFYQFKETTNSNAMKIAKFMES